MESKRSDSIMNLTAALSIAQGQIKSAAKDQEADTGKFKYKYATLDAIWDVARKPLADNGLAVVQIPLNNEGGFYLETILMHSSGEWISGQMTLPVVAGRMSELQAMGSAITYARRYMLGAMVGVTTGDDDDGQRATEVQPQRQNQNGMTLNKLLFNLNRLESISGFYKLPIEILDCRQPSATAPEADDIPGWRVLFEDARDYAKDQIAQADEVSPPGNGSDRDTYDNGGLFDDPPTDDAPGAYETE